MTNRVIKNDSRENGRLGLILQPMADVATDGIWLIDKPVGITSFGIIKKLRRILKMKKIGHAGTLDPLASGLLIVCSGSYTKWIESLMGMPKAYTGTIYLGAETESYDLEHPPRFRHLVSNIQPDLLNEIQTHFTGETEQYPPVHSAVKIDGKRAYSQARKGKSPEMKARKVLIEELKLSCTHAPELDFYVKCSKGTYIRSLAHDIGKFTGYGAYLSSLRRTAIGPFRVEDAMRLTDLDNLLNYPVSGTQKTGLV